MKDLGLVSVFPYSFYLAFLFLTLSYCISIHHNETKTTILLLHIALLIFMIYATPNIIYGTLRYSWSWKHVGIVDYILRNGTVEPNISVLGVYHNWPAFFSLNALATEVAGVNSAVSYAGWSQSLFNLIDLGAIFLIISTFTKDRRLIWLSIWFFAITNWVGQDYFSPQALNYFLYLVVIGVCLQWFRGKTPSKEGIKRWLLLDRAVHLLNHIFTHDGHEVRSGLNQRPFQRAGLMAVLILMLAVIASSHQLTPFIMISTLSVLVVFQRTNARSLPVLMGVFTAAWMVYIAFAFLDGNKAWIIRSIGFLFQNIVNNMIDLSKASQGQRLVAIIGRWLTVFVWGIALIGGIRRLRLGYWDLSNVLLILAPFPFLALNSYGGEILFRYYFFTLPSIAFFAAALVYPSPGSSRSWWMPGVTAVLSCLLLVGFFFAYYGKEQMYYFSQDEVKAAEFIHRETPSGSLIISGSSDWPKQFENYEFFTYLPLASSGVDQARLIEQPVETIEEIIADRKSTHSFIIFTRSQKADINTTGLLPVGSLDEIEKELLESRDFHVVFRNPDSIVFEYE